MNNIAIKKHEIYNKLVELTEQDLATIVAFIDFMRHKKQLEDKKDIKLEGVLKGYDIDFSDLNKFKEDTWRHVIEESDDG